MEIVAFILGAALAGILSFAWARKSVSALPASSSKPGSLPSKAGSSSDDLIKATEAKLTDAKAELAAHKEKLAAKQKELEELREQAKAKARRDGKKEAAAEEKKTQDPRDVEIQSLRKGMAALESQLNAAKRDVTERTKKDEAHAQKANADVEGAQKAAAGAQEKALTLEEQNADLKKTIDELRHTIKKAEARPDVPGTGIDLKSLSTPVVQELARFFRKGEEFERLYNVAQSQLQLEKDRTLEIQRRYFAVCRELAVHAGVPETAASIDQVAAAEAVIDGETKIEAKPTVASNGEGGEGGEKKKRRRRRRRKIAGESSHVEADGADDGDDGDDGDDVEDTPEHANEAASEPTKDNEARASEPTKENEAQSPA